MKTIYEPLKRENKLRNESDYSLEVVNVKLNNNYELVAVIGAVISFYENSSLDKFVVRSIKRRDNWLRA